MCLTQSQATVCANEDIDVGKPCDADGTPGICNEDKYCEPGCGDGVTDTTEQCDDGNFASHDGCSSRCLVEVATWVPDVPVWKGVSQLSAAYHPNIGSGRIVVIGGVDAIGISNKIWQIDPARAYELDGGWVDITDAFAPGERPEPRYGSPFAFHTADNALVLYGGAHSSGYYTDTWEYTPSTRVFNGEPVGTWTKRTTSTSPGDVFGGSMAYEPALRQLVLYGGISVTNPILPNMRPTWFYANGTWTSTLTTTKPLTSSRQVMAYDATRSVMVLYTAAGNPKTFEYRSGDWVEVSGANAPGPRRGAVMTYDPARAKLVLFGGTDTNQTQIKGDTWEFDGTWQLVPTPVAPPGRRTAAFVSEPVNNRLVLIGGSLLDGSDPFSDEWELTPSGWANRTPRFSPPVAGTGSGAYSTADGGYFVVSGSVASFELWSHNGTHWHRDRNVPVDRIEHMLAYDSDQKRILMTGGYCGYGDPYDCDPEMDNDPYAMPLSTYALDIPTRQWTKLPALWPVGKTHSVSAFVYDPVAHRSVVFGGNLESGDRATDTWVSDGTTWTELVTAEHPAATTSPAAGWDPVRASVIVFDLEGDTWELHDSTWTKILPKHDDGPVGREQAGMTYNPYRKRFVLIGGSDSQRRILDDVWELDTASLTWTRLFVPGASPLPRSGLVLGMHERRRAPILYGGSIGTLFGRSDVWFLEYVSDTPNEDCLDGMDTDEDAQNDMEDPDCTPPPPN